MQQWLAAYRRGGLDALAKMSCRDKDMRRFPDELVTFIEALARRRPRTSMATIHRKAESVAAACSRPRPHLLDGTQHHHHKDLYVFSVEIQP